MRNFFRYFISLSFRHKIMYIILFISVLVEFLIFNPFTNQFIIAVIADWLSKIWK